MLIIDTLFCHVDDFCQIFEHQWRKQLISHGLRLSSLCVSILNIALGNAVALVLLTRQALKCGMHSCFPPGL